MAHPRTRSEKYLNFGIMYGVQSFGQPNMQGIVPKTVVGQQVLRTLRDAQGRRLVELDFREVERRLMARLLEDPDGAC